MITIHGLRKNKKRIHLSSSNLVFTMHDTREFDCRKKAYAKKKAKKSEKKKPSKKKRFSKKKLSKKQK